MSSFSDSDSNAGSPLPSTSQSTPSTPKQPPQSPQLAPPPPPLDTSVKQEKDTSMDSSSTDTSFRLDSSLEAKLPGKDTAAAAPPTPAAPPAPKPQELANRSREQAEEEEREKMQSVY